MRASERVRVFLGAGICGQRGSVSELSLSVVVGGLLEPAREKERKGAGEGGGLRKVSAIYTTEEDSWPTRRENVSNSGIDYC